MDDVHRSRVASRRLREALAVLEAVEVTGSKRLRRQVRRLTRALGPVREHDVMRGELRAAARRHGWPRPVVVAWQGILRRARAKHRARMLRTLERADLKAMRREGRALAYVVRHTLEEPYRAALAARVSARAGDVVGAIVACGDRYDAERVHALRIAIKKLKYGMELEPDTPAFLEVRSALHDAQQGLGAWHDRLILTESARQHAPALTRAGGSQIAERLDLECRDLHAQVVARLPQLALAIVHLRLAPQDAPRRV